MSKLKHPRTFISWGMVLTLLVTSFLLTSCSKSASDASTSAASDALSNFFSDSANVSSVKDAYLDSCPSATLGEMADAFMSNPSWSDFPSSSGGTVVELSGDISYDNAAATALIQFDLSGSSFQAVYLGINDVDQSTLMLNSLLVKMCDATF